MIWDSLFKLDWEKLFVPSLSLAEIVLRGTLVYIALFLLLRLILKRREGTIGAADLLVLVLIADAAQNAMAGEYTSITEGILLVGIVIFWSYVFDWLGYRFPTIQRLVYPPPLTLVKNGQMLRRNMRQELITKEELLSQLREQGVEDVSRIKSAHLEGDGRISVIMRENASAESQPQGNRGGVPGAGS